MCAELLRRRQLLALDDLIRTSGGNLIALLETASVLSARRGEEPITDLPCPGQVLERAWRHRIDELPDTTHEGLACWPRADHRQFGSCRPH
jgi:hypothetical protein